MCVVIPMAATLAMSAASSAVGYLGQQQQANQQRDYGNAVYNQQQEQAVAQAEYNNRQVIRQNEYINDNATNAKQSLATDKAALVAQERQQGIATAIDLQNKRIERMRAQGAIQASERSGLTLESLLGDFDRQEAMAVGIEQNNLGFANEQRAREYEKLQATAQSRINSARPFEAAPVQTPFAPAPVQGPSLLGAGLNFASSAADTLNSRAVYDSTSGRYKIDTKKGLSTPLPTATSFAPRRDYSNGFSRNKTTKLK